MSKQPGSAFGSKLAVAITSTIVTAVVIAGGVAFASVPNNSVGSGKIINNSIRSEDLRDGAVKSIDIRNGSVTPTDVSPALQPYMARVAYSAGVPSITVQRGGLAIVNEPFAGAVRISFPRNVDTCAVVASAFTGGATTSVRRSTTGGGTEVVVVGFDDAGATVETNFDLIAQC